MLSDGMWYAAMRKMRMKRKIATALRSDVSEARDIHGSLGPLPLRAAATTDFLFADELELRFLAATTL
jgi:hypothetical protein